MTTPLAPSPAVFPKVQLTARQRDCLEQIARRQTSPQRLVRRAKILLTLETGANQCQVMRQLHLNRGTVQTWRQRWLAFAPKLVQMEIDGGSDKALTAMIRAALTDPPRSGAPAPFTAEQIVQIVAVACEDPAASGRPISHWPRRRSPQRSANAGLSRPLAPAVSGVF